MFTIYGHCTWQMDAMSHIAGVPWTGCCLWLLRLKWYPLQPVHKTPSVLLFLLSPMGRIAKVYSVKPDFL